MLLPGKLWMLSQGLAINANSCILTRVGTGGKPQEGYVKHYQHLFFLTDKVLLRLILLGMQLVMGLKGPRFYTSVRIFACPKFLLIAGS